MRRIVLGILLGLLVVGCMGAVVDLAYDNSRISTTVGATYQSEYTAVATLSACHGDPNIVERSYAEMAALPDANCAIWDVPYGANAACFRFHIDNDGNTATVRAATCRRRYNPGDKGDDFNLAWQWAITGGSQADSDAADPNVYCDTLVATTYDIAAGTLGTADPNWIEEYEVDLRGCRHVAFWRTDSDANLTVTVDAVAY